MTKKVFCLAALVLLCVGLAAAQSFVYTNDDVFLSNTVSGFSVASKGTLTKVAGSPFATGGVGNQSGFDASNRIKSTIAGNFLFVSNTVSNDVSVFTIDPTTGTLTLVPGSPFPTGGSGDGLGISVAPTPNGMFLMAGNSGSNNMSVLRIAGDGTLTPITGSPFPLMSQSDGIAVSPNGSFLAVAEGFQVEMLRIASDGSLTSIGGFLSLGGNFLAGVDINCANSLLYAGVANGGGTIVNGYSMATNGTLAQLSGSPFTNFLGINSNVVLLNHIHGRKDKLLFVSNQDSNTMEVFKLGKGGGLSLVAGSPFPMDAANNPAGMATNAKGDLLFVSNFDNTVSVFSVANKGALTEVAGSPFATGQPGGLLSLAAFPPRQCR